MSKIGPWALAALALCTVAPGQTPDLYDDNLLRTFDLTFHQQGWWTTLVGNGRNGKYVKADLTVDGKTYKDVGIRFRGANSFFAGRRTGKYPLKISMDEFVAGQDLYGFESMNFNNGWQDPGWVREALGYKLFGEVIPSPRTAWVNVRFNKTNWGPYLLVQPTNKDFLREAFHDNDGDRFKGVRSLAYLGDDPNAYRSGLPLVSKGSPGAYRNLVGTLKILFRTPSQDVPRLVPQVFDLDALERYYAIVNVISHRDGLLRHNYYLYVDPWHARMSVLPWDLNHAFNTMPRWWLPTIPSATHPQFLPRMYAYARTACEETFDFAKLRPWLTRVQSMLDKAVQADSKTLHSYGSFKSEVDVHLKGWINNRRNWILNAVPKGLALSAPSRSVEVPAQGQTVWVNVTAKGAAAADRVWLHWRSRNAFQPVRMFDDGQHNDGKANDGVFGAAVPGQKAGTEIEYWIEGIRTAQRTQGSITFLPWKAAHAPFRYRVAPLRTGALINEFLARNDRGMRDEKGEREDWIELVNPTSKAIRLDGMYLSDDTYRPTKWIIPLNTVLKPGARLLVWADDEPEDGPLHASFKLSGDGEEVVLVDTDGETVLDRVAFGAQGKDISTGRVVDGLSAFVTFARPTPGLPNLSANCGLRSYSNLSRARHTITLGLSDAPKIGSKRTMSLDGGAANTAFILLMAGGAGRIPLPGDIALLFSGPIFGAEAVPAGGQGSARVPFPIPDDRRLVGKRLYFQGFSADKKGLVASNALEVTFCAK